MLNGLRVGEGRSWGWKNWEIGNYSRCNEFESFATRLHWIISKWATEGFAANVNPCLERGELSSVDGWLVDDETRSGGRSQGSPPWPGQGPAEMPLCKYASMHNSAWPRKSINASWTWVKNCGNNNCSCYKKWNKQQQQCQWLRRVQLNGDAL